MASDNHPTISIIGGKGKMGDLFVSFFRKQGLKVIISDLATKISNREAAQKGDIVIVAVPMGLTEKVIKEVVPFMRKDALLADITSIKEGPTKAMRKSKGEILGMHPMFSDSNPISGQLILLCPLNSGYWTKWLKRNLKKGGAKLLELTAKEHDKAMSYSQALVHFADIVFGHALYKLKKSPKEILKFTSIASEAKILLSARLLAQDSHLYGNIQTLNKQNVKVLKQFVRSAKDLLKIVKKKDLKEFDEYFGDTKDFFGKYTQSAFNESTWLIDQILIHRKRNKKGWLENKAVSKNSIGVLGPPGTFSSLAANKYNEKTGKSYFSSIENIFKAVEQGKIKEGIVPVENRIYGTVRETFDALFLAKNVKIIKEIEIPIHHCLAAKTKIPLYRVKEIISHQQAISQCKKYIDKNCKNSKFIYTSSTASAFDQVLNSNNQEIAAIGPLESALGNNLQIIGKNIEDHKKNTTKFLIISKSISKRKLVNPRTSIVFYFGKNKAGTLYSVLKKFAEEKVSMTRIESRPAPRQLGEYIFFIDFEGSQSNPKIKKLLKAISLKVAKLKILGTF